MDDLSAAAGAEVVQDRQALADAHAAETPLPTKTFAAVQLEVEDAAREWGIRADLVEGKFLSALLGAIGWTGRVAQAAQAENRQILKEHREAAELELARAREITRAAQIALNQARNAQIALQVEHENVLVRMVEKTLPMFIDRMKNVLVLRERRMNTEILWRRYAVVGFVTLGVFLGGYGLCAWQDSAVIGAIARCVAQPLEANGHLYCDFKLLGG